ncbi:MAG: restriction endonuclease subunit S [Anaerolineae bacterium]|nr:restriction endonuclease subunit S [Anaerolineae bacterium]
MSGDEALSIPSGWVETTIGVITLPIEKVKPEQDPQQLFTYLDISSLDNQLSRVVEPKVYRGSEAPSRARQLVRARDTLFSTVRTYLRNIAMVPDAYDGQVASTGFSVLRGATGIEPRYLYYYALTDEFVDSLSELQRGTSYPAVRDSDVRRQMIPLAPTKEQRRIVDAIEAQFSRLDAAVAALERAKANLERYRASVLQAACEGRLVPTEADLARAEGRDYEPADVLLQRILAERRRRWEEAEWERQVERAKKKAAQALRKAKGLPARIRDLAPEEWGGIPEEEYARYLPRNGKWKHKYDEPEPPDTEGLPDLPEGWVWATVDQIGEVRLGRQRSPRHHQGPHMRPYLRAANATWEGVDLSDVSEMNFPPDDLETYRLQKDDILLAEASGSPGEVGKPFIWEEQIEDCCFQNTLIRVRLYRLPPEYVWLYFLSSALTGRFGEIAKGVGIHHLGSSRLSVYAVAVPPEAEQMRIVQEAHRRWSLAHAVRASAQSDLIRAHRLRQSVLKCAFEGRLVPQDPDDEPASALLARIHARQVGAGFEAGTTPQE